MSESLLCDRCGTTKVAYSYNAVVGTSFAGTSFHVFHLCKGCFNEFRYNFLISKRGTS